MKAKELYDWLFAEGEHAYLCYISVDNKYIEALWWNVKTGGKEIEWSDNPTRHFCNEEVPCFFEFIPKLNKDSLIRIVCEPIPIEYLVGFFDESVEEEKRVLDEIITTKFPHIYDRKHKEITFKAGEWEENMKVNFLNSKEITL